MEPTGDRDENRDREGSASHRERPGHDLRDIAWWLLDQLIAGSMTSSEVSSAGSVLRILASLGQQDDPASLREVELRGRLMQGLTPRDEEEWELARSIFDDAAIAEFERWEVDHERETFG